MRARCPSSQMQMFNTRSAWMPWVLLLSSWLLPMAQGMMGNQMKELRKETEHMFYHGYDNYLKYAFPEDELRPLTCGPLVRDRDNPAHIELNDVLGNYTLTVTDTLSTLAILASSPDGGGRAWAHFQDRVSDLVRLYGDGSGEGPEAQGERSRGFDLDSKVQVFETVIRGLGGLLSAHLFAVGDLPIRGYNPPEAEAAYARAWNKTSFPKDAHGIIWENGFVYNGQLLRLASDLANRILPAFYTETGLPYPRVNLRTGVPFYLNSPLNKGKTACEGTHPGSSCRKRRQPIPEITETCSAGAGSLVLEFTVMSRLVGDGRYEELAKRAFWAVWARRSEIGLIGSGIDAESGKWVHPYTGIGAGIDSFFEYAFKSYVLLSSGKRFGLNPKSPRRGLDGYYTPLSEYEHSPEAFLRVWQDSQASIARHLYRGEGYQHPHYIQGDVFTGATRAFWIDSLSAYFPGLLTLAGDVEHAIRVHLLATAVWTRYSGLPERWNVATGDIENGLTWWGGRPEFIESTYYLYQATKDPWYLHVGEMALRDIKRRCWTKCGWAGIEDVRSGELKDRMESFFLGETTKYMFMLYDPTHPLNNLDAPFVFSTEGHPLVIPASTRTKGDQLKTNGFVNYGTCQAAPPAPALGISSTAARHDLFHAASLARLQHMPSRRDAAEGSALLDYASDHPSVSLSDLSSPSNYTFYPWTLPPQLVPYNATSSPMAIRPALDISFPAIPGLIMGPGSLERMRDGILIKTIGGLRLSLVRDVPLHESVSELESESAAEKGAQSGQQSQMEGFRVQVINNVPLGKDEKVYLSREITFDILDPTDPNFTRVRDTAMVDLVVDVIPELFRRRNGLDERRDRRQQEQEQEQVADGGRVSRQSASEHSTSSTSSKVRGNDNRITSSMKRALSSLMNQLSYLLGDISYINRAQRRQQTNTATDDENNNNNNDNNKKTTVLRLALPASISTGLGSAPIPDVEDAITVPLSDGDRAKSRYQRLSWSSIYFADEICDGRVVREIAQNYQVLVVKRGGCSFSQKLRNIAAFPPSRASLKLVVVVSYSDDDDSSSSSSTSTSTSTSTNHPQSSPNSTSPNHHDNSTTTSLQTPLAALRAEPFLVRPHLDETQVTAGGIPRRHLISLVMVGGGEETYQLLRRVRGVGLKRRYSIQSQGFPISNLYIV